MLEVFPFTGAKQEITTVMAHGSGMWFLLPRVWCQTIRFQQGWKDSPCCP